MAFTSFSNPKEFVLESSYVGPKDKESTRIPEELNINQIDSDGKDKDGNYEGKATFVNQYNPAKTHSHIANESAEETKEIFNKVICEYMDYTDYRTNRRLMAMNEAEQNSVLVSLTNRLYGMIVGKIDSIDYGEITNSRGDITRLKHYDEMIECIKVLKDIFEQYHENTKPVQEIENAINNIEDMKALFVGAFAGNATFPISVYKTMTLACINSISFMIAVCIEYIKSPKNEGLEIVLNKTGISKVKESLVYESLVDFNDACRKGDVENCLRPLVQSKAKGLAPGLFLGIKFALVIGSVAVALLPIIKDLVYFFFAARARVSSYFDLQAKLLEMNAEELKNNADIKTEGDKKEVIRKQLAIAANFRKIADMIAIDSKKSEVEATNEIKKDNKKYKVDDVEDGTATDGPLF